MMRSLYSGVAGLRTHQTKMDVIGNNIANVNTVSYKSQSVTFQDLMYQTTQSASGANANTGRAGINAKQIGLGVKNGSISTAITTAGASQNTGNPFDIQINSDAFFIVSDGQNNFFTRAGAFNIDANGTLCMSTNGYTVQGWLPDEEGNIIKNTVQPLNVMKAENLISPAEATSEAYMTGIIDKNDEALKTSDGLMTTVQFYDQRGYSYTIKYAIHADPDPANEGKYTMTAVDILNSEGKSLLTEYAAADGTKATIDQFIATEGQEFALEFDPVTGKYVKPGDDPVTFDIKFVDTYIQSFPDNIELRVDALQNIDNKGSSTISGRSGNQENTARGAGHAAGEMSSLSVEIDGKIRATYTNGVTKIMGQIAVANFTNPAGLQKEGENLYSATANSGTFNGIGVDITADGGSMSSGVLEMSNVDLSSEFTEMITTQRGFQANSRIITVSDTLLEELINLKR